ncbi:MAG: PilZ domain-containing protein [Phycisphaerae bacterium]|nr:PilZ domain-containing protein [Phycisphaerae bacterium]
MLERRKGARLPLEARAVYRLFDGTFHEADLIDVGQGGLRLRSVQPLRAGTWLELEIIPGVERLAHIHCHGRVRWQSPRRQDHIIGVQLEGSSAQIKQWLAGLRAISATITSPDN